jgi:C-terminal processing protease CtpA/Prc
MPLGKFIDRAFQRIQDRGARALVIDVRDNDGGSHELAERLFSHLADGPFRYYRDLVLNDISFSFLPHASPSTPVPADAVKRGPDGKYHHVTQANWGTQRPTPPRFGGKVYVLMNGGSFSCTCEFLAAARCRTKAVLIGEESGGAFGGNTSGLKYDVRLPNSKHVLRLPVVAYQMEVDGRQPAGRGVLPDHAARPSIEDLLGGTDGAMELALRMARE